MKIIVNVDAIHPPLTGVGRYAYELALGLAKSTEVTDLRYYSHGAWIENINSLLVSQHHLNQTRKFLPKNIWVRRLIKNLESQIAKKRLKPFKDYIFHAPNYFLPPFAGKTVTTVHDLSCLHYSQYHPKERVAFFKYELPKSLQQATAIITVSEFVKQELIATMAVDPAKIWAIPNGVGPAYCPQAGERLDQVLGAYQLQKQAYLLAVSTFEPRKNLSRLINAYMQLPETTKREFPLVLVGAKGWLNEDLMRQLEVFEAAGYIKRLGFVPEADLPYLYSGARAFAMPALYEGFGLPVLEAMACGAPVLTSQNTAMAEIVHDAGVLVDPNDESSIAAGLSQLLENHALAKQLVQRGLLRAAQYSWQSCVDKTIQVYQNI